MKVEYTYLFSLPRDSVWKYIQDKEVLQNALPGCQRFEEKLNGIYHAEMGLNIGPVKGLFSCEVRQVQQQPPSSYCLLVKGKGKLGEIDAVAHMNLEEVEGGTKLICLAEVQVNGGLASAGKRVMGGVAKIIVGQFFKTAEAEMKKQMSRI